MNFNEELEIETDVDPINDIIDYLIRCANISFKNAHVDEKEATTREKTKLALNLYKTSPLHFLMQFGKYLAPSHLQYFENHCSHKNINLQRCIEQLKTYHSDVSRRKRVRNRRYKALQKMQKETDYFSEKQMMLRNPLLYEQLVGQYLTDEEVQERDGVDRENLNLLTMILDTVDRNTMREMKEEQEQEEAKYSEHYVPKIKQWGDFDDEPKAPQREVRKQKMISAPERDLLREEFLQEMYSSFIEGNDIDMDYSTIDNDEQYDDLQQVSQDAEDKYFDSELNDAQTLEEHMKLMDEYGKNNSNTTTNEDDPLDVFMKHISNKKHI